MPEFAATPGEDGVTDVRQDLARYDSVFGLPAAHLGVVTTLAPGSSPFQAPGESAGDVEIVHAIAPQAAIRVLLIPADVSFAQGVRDFNAALRMAPSLGSVVSITQGGFNESCLTSAQVATIHSALEFDRERHVTVAVAAGDFGAEGQPCTATPTPARAVVFPASDPLALAVGGTSLHASRRTGAYIGETVWNRPIAGLPGGRRLRRGLQRRLRPSGRPGAPARHRRTPGRARWRVRRRPRHRPRFRRSRGRTVRHLPGRRDERGRAGLGRDRGPGRSVRGPASRLHQPRHLRDRPQRQVPPRVPRCHQGRQHRAGRLRHRQGIRRRTRLGPGHRLGQPERPGAHPAARPLRRR